MEERRRQLTIQQQSKARYVRVLEIIYEALANNIIMTKRDIFYRDVPLFKTQPTVDKVSKHRRLVPHLLVLFLVVDRGRYLLPL